MQATPYPAPSPYYQPPPATGQEPIRPSTAWFWLAGVVAVVGIAVGITIAVRTAVAFTDRIEDFQRIDVPGSGTVVLDDPGGYTIYYEYGPGEDGLFIDDQDLAVVVTGPDGSQVPLDLYDSSVTYSNGEYGGEAVFSFTAEQAGQYEVTAQSGSGGIGLGDELEGEVAVGRSLARGIVGGVVGALVTGLVGVVGAAAIAIVVGVARGRERRRRRIAFARSQSAWPSATPGPPGHAAPPPPQTPYGTWPHPHAQPSPQPPPSPPPTPPPPSTPPPP